METVQNNQPPKDLRTFKVFTIEDGTVIDHIDAGQAIKIIRILNLAEDKTIVTVGLNLESKEQGHKDLIKVEHRELTKDEANKVAIFAPNATINIIRNFKVAEKFKISIPETIERLIVCPNPTCITNNERMNSRFHISHENGSGLTLQCAYCEKIFSQKNIYEYKSN
ncbi:MAG: aspartate carbamoyltransferase regulatory subunit [Candidatus Magasanikbacteria bacterium]